LKTAPPLGQAAGKPDHDGHGRHGCAIELLDAARLEICTCEGALLVHAAAGTRLELVAEERRHPRVSVGKYQGQDVVVFEGGAQALALPLKLAAKSYVPVVVGITGARGHGVLRIDQRLGSGELSGGYEIRL
jgi:hypothetical protein